MNALMRAWESPRRGGKRTGGILRVAMFPAALLLTVTLLVEPGGAQDAELEVASRTAPDTTMLVRVERMGGFAGVHESWTLHASGQVWFVPVPGVAGSVVRTLGPDLMDQVRGVLGAGIGRGPVGVPGAQCSDCFLYRVVVAGPGTTRDVIVGEHRLAEASPELRRLVGMVAGRGPPPFLFPVAAEERPGSGAAGAAGG